MNDLRFPSDWPPPGRLDLAIHDLPHPSSTLEWWYLNAHVETRNHGSISLFASFFRLRLGRDPQSGQCAYAHSLAWALVDPQTGRYLANSSVDPRASQIVQEQLARNYGESDPRLRRALQEVLDKGTLPYPDVLIQRPINVAQDRLDLAFGDNRFWKDDESVYHLQLAQPESGMGCDLCFRPKKPPVRHGADGVVRGVGNETMFYYFLPACQVEGELLLDYQPAPVEQGGGWYDHEFGRADDEEQLNLFAKEVAWNWVALQLNDGAELTAYDLYRQPGGESCGRWAILVDRSGQRHEYRDFTLTPAQPWTSMRTFATYPTSWRLVVPEAGIDLLITASFVTQEFITLISRPAFWEGRVTVTGMVDKRQVEGLGFAERSGFAAPETLPTFLNAVGQETRASVKAILPLEPTPAQACWLIADDKHEHFLQDVALDQYARTVIQPIRTMIDRGGKAWRSYAALACIDLVGGNANDYRQWLAVPELLHTGSLIIDDIEDRSTVRRGGLTCHVIYGEPLAINAGTAAYFLWHNLIQSMHLTVEQKLRIYELYFATMRAAHAGQALDIAGLADLMPQVVASGAGRLLEDQVLAIHRLKSAVPARLLAEIGAIVGNGTPAQVGALGDFFEALGLAFQIMDDVLNLRGFQNNLKTRGEDITQGKITMPVAKAMGQLPREKRAWLWQTLASKPTDLALIGSVIDLLESCCALTSCIQQAHDLMERAWQRLDPLVGDSYSKVMLRGFSWFVLERHY